MEGLDVICPGCKKSFHVTTKDFNPYITVNGSMLRLKDPWRKWGWCSFGDDGRPLHISERKETHYMSMACPGCHAPLAIGGYLTVTLDNKKPWVKPPEEFYTKKIEPLVFEPDYSNLETEWNKRVLKSPIELGTIDLSRMEGSPGGENNDVKIILNPIETQYQKVKKMKDDGMTQAKIAESIGLSRGRVSQILKTGEKA